MRENDPHTTRRFRFNRTRHLLNMFRLCVLAMMPLSMLAIGQTGVNGQTEYRYVITGKAVDGAGRPIPNAYLLIERDPLDRFGDFGVVGTADASGRFRIEIENCSLELTTRMLWVTGAHPVDSITLVEPPFQELSIPIASNVRAHKVSIVKDGEADVGEIEASVFYTKRTFVLQDSYGRPLLVTPESWKGVAVRIRDQEGHFVVESPAKALVGSPVNPSESALSVALPEGCWKVLIWLPATKKWLSTSSLIDFGPELSNNPIKLRVR